MSSTIFSDFKFKLTGFTCFNSMLSANSASLNSFPDLILCTNDYIGSRRKRSSLDDLPYGFIKFLRFSYLA